MQHQPATWVSSAAKGKTGNDTLIPMELGLPLSGRVWSSSKPPPPACHHQLVELLGSVWSVSTRSPLISSSGRPAGSPSECSSDSDLQVTRGYCSIM